MKSLSHVRPADSLKGRWVLLLLPLWLASCGKEEIRVEKVPKEQPQSLAQIASDPLEAPQLGWKVPVGWIEKPASGMRVASFSISGGNGQTADVSVIPLQGWTGRELENINRWRGQVGLEPITREDLPKQTEVVDIGGTPGQLFEMAGAPPDHDKKIRILAAVLPQDNVTWFFKMTGEDALVQEQEQAFAEFLKSVEFPEAEVGSGAVRPSRPTSTNVKEIPTKSAGQKPAWTVPPVWEEQPPGAMQLARFRAADKDGGKAEVTVTVLPGDGGGALANVNRWREKQLGLAPVDQAGLTRLTTTLDLGGTTAMLVDMTADNQLNRIVAAIVPREGHTWFFKLAGDGPAVGRQKEAFIQFVRSAP